MRVETPSIQAEQITAYRALSTRRRGWSREGKNDPVRSLGMASSTSPAVVATVLRRLPLRLLVRSGVRDVALRADHGGGLGVDQILQPGLEQTPEDLVVSKIGVGQDFPDQRGHGRLATGHRGCTPCESWSRNLGSHDARRPPGPAGPLDAEGPRELPPH